ncbi:olfactory receptor 11H7 [Camelus ferus]|nr:olfactory receptor 11H7 [Camelus ferus]
MAYDRYLAVCRPLRYPTIMTQRLCSILMSLCWVFGFLSYSVSTVQLSQLPFCGPNTIDHFLCDMDPLMALSCAPAPVTETVFYVLSSLIIILTLLYILGSYTALLITVLKVPSAAGRQKAFSTCGSHLTVVCLFFGALLAMYVSPTADNPAEIQKIMTLFYSVVTPFLNPLIYSLRNKEMKAALKKVLRIQ